MKIKILSALALALTINSCADDTIVDPAPNDQTATVYGTPVKLGNDSARTYVKVDSNGNPTAIGIAIDAEAINGLGNTPSMNGLPLPNAANSKLPFKYVSMDWNPQGHDPLPLYSEKHFDFHFYTITETEMHNISTDSNKMYKEPNPSDVPAGYTGYIDVTPGPGRIAVGGAPMMGWHLSDSTAPVIPGTFDKTFIYGFYNGKMDFMEPMITKDFLETKTTFTADIKQPQTYLTSGNFWPTKYTIRFDAAANQYIVEMHDMVKH
jgi:hypothetical protein